MITNLEKYKKDLDQLIIDGNILLHAIQYECHPSEFEAQIKKVLKQKSKALIKSLPRFSEEYQNWYSEALIVVKLLLPDRRGDFVKLYEKPKNRKSVEYGNYVVEDYLQSLTVTNYGETKVGPYAAIPQFQQQLNILKSANKRFESSLFNITQLVQADLLGSELDAAQELNKKGFTRGAGAIAGVVLEKHLAQICENHTIKSKKKKPGINDFNQLLRDNNVIEVKDWRFIQHLADVRNMCDHKKEKEPSPGEIDDLIEGVERISKTIY